MLKKLIPYKDWNRVDRKENFYFNLTKTELIEMELSTTGGMRELLRTIMEKQDIPKLMKAFKEIILKAYGEKSADGRVFNKSPELSAAFEHSPAYDVLYLELINDANKAAEFITDIMPADMRDNINPEKALTPIDNVAKEEVVDAALTTGN